VPLEFLFWLMAAILAYVYVGYPLLVYVAARITRATVNKASHQPRVSILIAAYNEAAHIDATIANKLALDYPADRLQIIVVSDGSTDGTDGIVAEYASRGVMGLRQEPRNGKTSALNLALAQATGEIIVFADANSLYARESLRHLVGNFADPRVGYVTGTLGYVNQDGTMTGDGCSLYMRYENFIRASETQLGSVVGVNGGIDAVRRSLFQPMKADDLPDLVLPLRVIAQGYRVVYEPAAILSETANASREDEYKMRVRVALRALWTLAEMPDMLSVPRHGVYAIQLISHKALRYLAFVFMIGTFATALVLTPYRPVYAAAFIAQMAVAISALLGFLAERQGWHSRALSIPYYFVLVNAAASAACVKFITGQRSRVWQPRIG